MYICVFIRWFHGKIARKDAENILITPGNARGTFLIRESETAAGIYLRLCVV